MNLLHNKFLKTIVIMMSLILAISAMSVSVLAADDMEAAYYESQGLVRVYAGMNTQNANAPITVWIVQDGSLYYAYQTNAKSDGSVELTFNLSDVFTYDEFNEFLTLKANVNGTPYTLEPAEGKDIEITQLEWNVDTKTLTVNGLCLLDEEIALKVLDSASETVTEQTTYAENGMFGFEISLADQSFGKYTVKVLNADESICAEDSFIYKSPENVVDELNSDATGEGFALILKDIANLKALGVASWVNAEGNGFMDLTDETYAIMAKASDKLTDAESVMLEAQRASLVNALNNSVDETESEDILFNIYKIIINTEDYPLVSAYNDLESDTIKQDVISAITAQDIESYEDFDLIMAEKILLPQINSIKVGSALKQLVSDNADYFDMDDTLTTKEYSKAIKKGPYDTIEDFCDECNDIIEDREKGSGGSSSRPSGGSSSRPSGGSGVSPVVSGNINIGTTTIPQVPAKTEPEEVFSDLGDAVWAKDAILALYEKGVVSGYGDGTFNPGGVIRREEFIKMLVAALNLKEEFTDAHFTDVIDGAWYSSYINTAYASGIVAGKPDGTFGIGESVTRQDAAVFLWRAFNELSEIAADPKEPFADEKRIAPYASEAVTRLHNLGIVNGMDENRFMPSEPCTRAQAAQLIYTIMIYGKGDN